MGILDNINGTVWSGFVFGTQMGEQDHIISAFSSGGINRILNDTVKDGSLFALAEIIDEFTVFLEEGGGSSRKGIRSGYANDTDPGITEIMDGIGFHKIQFVSLRSGIGNVAGNLLEIGFFSQNSKLIQTIVEFMVAKSRVIISGSVHEINDVFTLGNSTDHITLDRVTTVDKQDIVGN